LIGDILNNTPLGIPIGSVRAILAFLIVSLYFIAGIVNHIDITNDLRDLSIAVIAFYFGFRANNKGASQ
jgi:hypothetical protein